MTVLLAAGLLLAGCQAMLPGRAGQPAGATPVSQPTPVRDPTAPALAPSPSPTRGATLLPSPQAIAPSPTPAAAATPGQQSYTYRVVATYPHDTAAYTEGLVWDRGSLYEGTGLYGQSDLRRVDLATGRVLQRRAIPPEYFGEGIAVVGEDLYELTWQSHVGFVYDRTTFAPQRQFSYPSEGWGLTYDGRSLIMSDGTATLHFLDPVTLQQTGQITVTDRGAPVMLLNELEYIRGQIYANVWHTDRIAIISPQTGQVTAWVDLTGLRPRETLQSADAVLNGIAYDPAGDRLFVTGKQWPSLYQIELVPQ